MVFLAFAFMLVSSPAFAGSAASWVCKALSAIKDYDKCWTCTILMIFFDSSNALAADVAQILETPAKNVLAVGLGVWLAFHTAIFFSSVSTEPNLAEFATKVGAMCLRAAFAIVFLSGMASVAFDYFVSPVITAGAQTGTLLGNSSPIAIARETIELGSDTPYSPSAVSSGMPMSSEVRSAMYEMVGSLGNGLKEMQKVANAMRCGSFEAIKIPWPLSWILASHIWDPLMWLFGCVIGVIMWLVALLFPMILMDAMIRLGMMMSLVPAFVVAWVFPSTRHFSKTGFDIILNSCFLFVITAIVLNIIVAMISESAGFDNNFFAALEASNYEKVHDIIWEDNEKSKNGVGPILRFIITVCAGLFAIMIVPKSDKLAAHFAGGDFPDSCGLKALHLTVELIINLIMLILTVVTVGMGSVLVIAKFFHATAKTLETIEKIRKALEKIKKIAEKAAKAARAIKAKIPGG